MDAYSRDLLRGIGGGDDGEQKVQRLDSQGEEVELSLGLSLGGRFGTERRSGEGLASSSSVACIQEVAPAPPALAKTNALPTMADAEAGNKQNLGDLRAFLGSGAEVQPSATPQGSGFPLNSIKEEPVAMLRASLCPSPGSSDGQGILTRTSSFPAGIEGGFRKRNLKKLEVKRRIERMKSSKVSVEEVGENLDEIIATSKDEKVENCDDLSMKNELPGGKPKVQTMNHSNVRRRSSGLPPPYKAPRVAQMPGFKRQNSALKGTHSAEGGSLSSALVPSSSAPAVRAAALGFGGEQQDVSERPTTRATRSVGDVREMPLVWTSGLPNGRRTVGFLYEYRKVDEVRIICACHGSFLTPAEFVEHAGGGQVANPLRRILVKSPPWH